MWMKCSEALMRWSLNASRWFRLKFARVHLLAGSLDVSATVCIWIPSSDLSQCLCLVAAGQCACAGLWPCLLLPYKVRVPLDTEGSEVRPSIIQGSLPHSNPVAEVHGVANAIPSCPRATQLPPHHHIHSLRDMLQLANLTSCLLSLSIPPPSASIPLSAELNALFIPFSLSLSLSLCLSLLSPVGVFSCVCCVLLKRHRSSERCRADFSEP